MLQLWQDEMLPATNMAFGLFSALTRDAAEAIAAHASEDLKTTDLSCSKQSRAL